MYKIFGKLAVLAMAMSSFGCDSELQDTLLTESFTFLGTVLTTVLSTVATDLVGQV